MRVAPGEYVMRAGEEGDCMYFISAGTVAVFVQGKEVDRLKTGLSLPPFRLCDAQRTARCAMSCHEEDAGQHVFEVGSLGASERGRVGARVGGPSQACGDSQHAPRSSLLSSAALLSVVRKANLPVRWRAGSG